MWDEARKLFASSRKCHPEVALVGKDLGLADVSLGEFLTSKFALWLDLRTTDDDWLHGSGHRIENESEGVTIQLTKTAEAAGALNIYLYIIMDGQLNLEDGRVISAVYRSSSAQGRPFGNCLRADGMRKKRFPPVSARRRPLPGVLLTHRDPVPHHRAQQDINSAPGSGPTLRSMFWTPVSAFMITCRPSTWCLRVSQHFSSSTTARP